MSLMKTGIPFLVTLTVTISYPLIQVTHAVQQVSAFPPFDTSNSRSTYFHITENKRLQGHKFNTVLVQENLECVQKCSSLIDECINVNFKQDSKGGLHECELLEGGSTDLENSQDDNDKEFGSAAMLMPNFSNCADIYKTNAQISGLYRIRPVPTQSTTAYCDMVTSGGGWTVIQKRQDGSIDFNRRWSEYKKGFGNKLKEHWLGLDAIHSMTSQRGYRLRVDLEDFEGNTRFAEYDTFSVAGEKDNYALSIGGYGGDAGDSLTLHNKIPFSTIDRDNDRSKELHCSVTYKSGWWFDKCHTSNLNGIYLPSGNHTEYIGTGINWLKWTGLKYSLKKAEMKIRPKDFHFS